MNCGRLDLSIHRFRSLRPIWNMERPAMSRELSNFGQKLMRAMGLDDPRQLDKLMAAPISQWAADHSEPPDEEDAFADRMYQEADRQWDARKRFALLSASRYVS
jgi:hypothetical protein